MSAFMKTNALKPLAALALLLLLPPIASAHILPDGTHGFHDGVTHPLTGLDHLLAMLAVGLWAVQQQGRSVWLIPLAFVSLMTVGGIIGITGALMPGAELVIALSILVLGLLVATAARFKPGVSMLIVGLFALFHGYAHGHEMPASATAVSFSAGFVLTTVALHAAGMLAGAWLRSAQQMKLIRLAGGAMALCSVYFLV